MEPVAHRRDQLFAMDQEFGRNFFGMREIIFRSRPDGLSLMTKELILMAFDIAANNKAGALRHLQAAREAGLTQTQLVEILMESYLVLGISSLSNVGFDLWFEWLTSRESDAGG